MTSQPPLQPLHVEGSVGGDMQMHIPHLNADRRRSGLRLSQEQRDRDDWQELHRRRSGQRAFQIAGELVSW